LRERGGVREIKMKRIEILSHYHPHPVPPPSRGRGKLGFPDGHYIVNI
jgi:hypothetical protein